MALHEETVIVISSPDLVLAIRRRIKKRGRGREKRQRDLAKYDCVGQNLAHASNCACSKSDLFFMCTVQSSSSITRCVLLLKTRLTKFKALKTQTVRDCEGCSADMGDMF